jgi:hypothetical protein
VALERQKFFSKPRLALDAVGGESAARLADALGEGGQVCDCRLFGPALLYADEQHCCHAKWYAIRMLSRLLGTLG